MRTPGVERILRLESGIEMRFQRLDGAVFECRKLDSHLVGLVGDQFTEATGLEDRGKAAVGRLAPGLQQHQDRRHLVEVFDLDHAVASEQRFEGGVIAGDRAGMGYRHRGAQRRFADF